MRLAAIVALCILPAATLMAEESLPPLTDVIDDIVIVRVPIREFRIFPSLEPYRSGTVPLHLYLAANRADDGGGYGGGYGGPGGRDSFGIFGGGNPTGLRMGHISGGSTGSRTTGSVAGTTGVGICGCH